MSSAAEALSVADDSAGALPSLQAAASNSRQRDIRPIILRYMFDQMRRCPEGFAVFFREVLRVFVEDLANRAGDIDAFNQIESMLKTQPPRGGGTHRRLQPHYLRPEWNDVLGHYAFVLVLGTKDVDNIDM